METEIFKATIFDLNELTRLFNQYRIYYKQGDDITSCKLFLTERLRQQDSVIYIARNKEGTTFGFVQLYPLFSSVQLKRLWLLNDLYVEEKYRKIGVAQLLIERSKKLVAETNATALLLETAKDNLPANKLYEQTDFERSQNNFYYWYELPDSVV